VAGWRGDQPAAATRAGAAAEWWVGRRRAAGCHGLWGGAAARQDLVRGAGARRARLASVSRVPTQRRGNKDSGLGCRFGL